MATARIDVETQIHHNIVERSFRSAGSANPVADIARQYSSSVRLVPAGTELMTEGDLSGHLFVVLDGWMFLHRILMDGRRQILDFALPGAVLGYRASPLTPFACSVEAVTNAEVAVIPLIRLGKLLYGGSESALILLEAANEALLGAFDSLTDMGRRTAREAVAHFLLRMEKRIRQNARPSMDGTVSFPLCQEHIGDALGLTSVHVCRTLGKLRNDGLVEVGQGRLRIIDPDALAEEAGVYYFDDDLPLAS